MESPLTTVMALSALVVSVLVASKVVNVSESTTNIDQSSVVYVTGGLTKNTQADNETAITLDTNITDIKNAAYGAVYTLEDGNYTGQTKTIVAKMPVDVYVQTGWGTMKLEADHSGGEHTVSLYWDGTRWEVLSGPAPPWHVTTTKFQSPVLGAAAYGVCLSSDGTIANYVTPISSVPYLGQYFYQNGTYVNVSYLNVDADLPGGAWSMTCSSNGLVVAIGATQATPELTKVYRFPDGGGAPTKYTLQANDTDGNDEEGESISMTADGSIVVVGATLSLASGAVATFGYDETADNYTQLGQLLQPIDIPTDGVTKEIGRCVRVTPDGETLIVFSGSATSNGRWWRFTRNSDGINWDQQGNATEAVGVTGDIGDSCDISSDASVIAAVDDDNANLLVWRKDPGSADFTYTETVLKPTGCTGCGENVAVSGDGNTIVTGQTVTTIMMYVWDEGTKSWIERLVYSNTTTVVTSDLENLVDVSYDGRTHMYSLNTPGTFVIVH